MSILFNATLTVVIPFTFTSLFSIPTKDTTKIIEEFSGTVIENAPLASAVTPLPVPFTDIVAPSKGKPASSVITPFNSKSANGVSFLNVVDSST